VPIYYESRLIRVSFDSAVKEELDEAVEEIMESEESTLSEKAKTKWTQVEAVVGNKDRLKDMARDLVSHFESRCEIADGKGMIVTMSRRIAVELYDEIINLRPSWHGDTLMEGAIKVVMTSTASDPQHFHPHHTTKKQRKDLAKRLKDPMDPLKLAIVRDMWLTGFDAPCLHTMYVDKPMKGHGLMQAIARVNRKYKDKQGGLVVDYIGILSDLKRAMNDYTESGGKGDPAMYLEQAVDVMREKFEVVSRMFHGFGIELDEYLVANPERKLEIILEAEDFILGLPDGKKRFVNEVTALSKAYSLAKTSDFGMSVKERVAFFQAIKSRLVKLSARGTGMSFAQIDTTIRQLVDRALQVDGVLDVFEAAGIEKPEISILSDDFLDEVRTMKHKNMAVELLQKLLQDQVKAKLQVNIVQEQKFSAQLEAAVRRYQNNMITSVEVIEELIRIAKEFREQEARHEDMGLTEEELAFYDALADNESGQASLAR
jgi:type I restriction enzyme R subunit